MGWGADCSIHCRLLESMLLLHNHSSSSGAQKRTCSSASIAVVRSRVSDDDEAVVRLDDDISPIFDIVRQILLLIAGRAKMQKVMCTVFKGSS